MRHVRWIVLVLLDMEARVQAMWEQMNKGLGKKPVKPVLSKSISSTMNANSKKFNDVRILSFTFF